MKLTALLTCFVFSLFTIKGNASNFELTQSNPSAISIFYPKNNQKVRGNVKIYGRAKPGSIVKLEITSTYFKKIVTQNRISQGEGPINRLNRTFKVTTNKSGVWILDNIELINFGWEENFTIKAFSDGKIATVNVFDHTHPILID
jgi:hypothetical protein